MNSYAPATPSPSPLPEGEGPSDVEPRGHPNVLDRKDQPQEQLHRHRQQHAHRKKLKSHVLQDASLREELQFEFIRHRRPLPKFLWRYQVTEAELAALHQPMKEKRANYIEPADDDQTEDCLRDPVAPDESEPQNRRDNLVQVAVAIKDNRVVIPRLARPEPDPAPPADECADENH